MKKVLTLLIANVCALLVFGQPFNMEDEKYSQQHVL
jgi:hypothetical protein